MGWDVYRHLPLRNGIFYAWDVAFSIDGGMNFTAPRDRGYVFFSNRSTDWLHHTELISDLVEPGTTHVQLRLLVLDLANIFGFATGIDATPAPVFDNVFFVKTRINGPTIVARTIDLFQDSFPQGGGIDASTVAARDLLDIRIDMALDINSGNTVITPGDSTVMCITPLIAGTTVDIADMSMEWILDRNPLFDDVRTMPAGTSTVVAGAANGWDQWTGSVAADSATTNAGTAFYGRFFFDLPDADFMYPGDQLRYYIRAEDSGSNVTILPRGIGGFGDGLGYNRTYVVRGLPSIIDDGAGGTTQPGILLINDFGRRGGEEEYLLAFHQNGLHEGIDFDSYTVQGPSSGVSNGIGSEGAHGANALQLADYDCIVYVSGNLGSFTLSEGVGTHGRDKGNDIGVLTDWHNLAGDRFAVFFGDELSSDLAGLSSGAGTSFLQNVLAVSVNDNIVRDDIDGQPTPRVVPTHGSFSSPFVAFGGCLDINDFDNIVPSGTAVAGHDYLDLNGVASYTNSKASVVYDRLVGSDRKVDITFPYGMIYIRSDENGPASTTTVSTRARVLGEVLGLFGNPHASGNEATGNESTPKLFESALTAPNPFNPATTIRFASATRSQHSIRIFDARGRLVRTLLDEMRDGGDYQMQWDGRDASGQGLASGVYLIEVVADGHTDMQKGVLLK